MSYHRLDKGLVVVLTGIEGRSQFNEGICRGLEAGGVDWAIELHDWTADVPLKQVLPPVALYNQRAEARNRRQAEKLAARVLRYQQAYPGRSVVLVGQSGGAALAAWTAENMPHDRRIDGVIMLAPSLSPTYALDQALEGTQRGIVNFYSKRDLLFLALGTTMAGTMDGEHTQSAGRVGFEIPTAGGKPPAYDRLFQIAWSEKMADTGNYGIHLSSGGERFVAAYVAPLVLAPTWDSEQMARVANRASPVTEPAGPVRWTPGKSYEEETARRRPPATDRRFERAGP